MRTCTLSGNFPFDTSCLANDTPSIMALPMPQQTPGFLLCYLFQTFNALNCGPVNTPMLGLLTSA
jgi:hypothetical protein